MSDELFGQYDAYRLHPASQIEVKRLLSTKPRCLEHNPGRILLHMSSLIRPACRKGENGAAGMEFEQLGLLVQIRSSKFW